VAAVPPNGVDVTILVAPANASLVQPAALLQATATSLAVPLHPHAPSSGTVVLVAIL